MSKAYLNDVQAGDYEIVAPYWDEILSKPGQPFDFKRHRRGTTVTLDVEQARRLVHAGAVIKPGETDEVEAPGAAQSTPPGAPAAPNPGTADAVLAEVGDDKELAQAALEEELAKEKPRKGLVAELEKILAA